MTVAGQVRLTLTTPLLTDAMELSAGYETIHKVRRADATEADHSAP